MTRALAAVVLAAAWSVAFPTDRSGPGWELRVTNLQPGSLAIDWDAVRARTASVERARDLRGAYLDGAAAPSSEMRRLLDAAQAAIGAPPSWWKRLRLPLRPDAAEVQRLRGVVVDLQRAAGLLDEDTASGRRHLAALEQVHRVDPARRPLAARASAARDELDERARQASSLLSGVSEDLRLRTGGFLDRVRHSWRYLTWRDAETRLDALRAALRAWGATLAPPVLGADLTYVQGALGPQPMPTSSVTPAYMAAAGASGTLEDTTEGREVELSEDVRARAAELVTAKAAYDFVKNQTRLDWYFGSLKGATETLREARGNDADLAALLVALLRAQGTSARYVQGTIELPLPTLAGLMGLLSAAEVDALANGTLTLSATVRDAVIGALSATGIPFEPVASGGQLAAVRFVHTWVEAFVPYSDYRGAGRGLGPRQWVPMDPSFTGVAKYAARVPLFDAFQRFGLSAASLTDAYLAAPTSLSPLAFTRGRVEQELRATNDPATYGDLLRSVPQRIEELPFIPGSLPYRVVSVHEEMAFLPDAYKHRVRIRASDAAGTFLDATLPLHQLVGRRSVLAYEPATEVDADVVASAGGLYQAPASAVEVTAAVHVDGVSMGRASRSVGLGVEHAWSIELLLPNGSSRRIDNRIIAGNLVALGFGGPSNGYVERPAAGSDLDGPAPRFLYGRAAAYATAWTQAEEELGQLLQVVPARPTASVVLVQNQLAVEQSLGIRRRVVWRGLEVDADHRSMTPLELVPGRGRELMRLSGYQGSYLESRVLRDGTGEQSVSAVDVIQLANATGVPVLHVTPANAATMLPQLSTTADVLEDVQDQLARGREVLIPTADQTIQSWTGTGFIARAPETEEGGYFLSGVISGAQTVVSPGAWLDQALAELLTRPEAPAATSDLSLVARIVKVPSSDLQRVVVGNRFPNALSVIVTTAAGVPVSGARVTFSAVQGARPTFRDPTQGYPFAPGPLTVTTDYRGWASIEARPDEIIAHSALLAPGTPNEQFQGLNVVTAETLDPAGNRLVLANPFYEIGLPDAPARIALSGPGTFSAPLGLLAADDFIATLTDRFDNPLANREVTWSQSPVNGRFIEPSLRPIDHEVVLDPSDPAQVTVLRQTTSSLGRVVMNLIAGGATTVTASSGPASASYAVSVDERGRNHLFAMVPMALGSLDGIYYGSFPRPFVFQVLRRGEGTGPAWTPLRGDEPGYRNVSVTMTVADGTTPIAEKTARPSELGVGTTAGLDHDRNVVFWPRYLLRDKQETVSFRADVVLADGTHDCCDGGFSYVAGSSTVPIATMRVLPGRIYQPTDGYGNTQPDDVAVAFEVTNRASYPIYARIRQIPNVPGEVLVQAPPPEDLVSVGGWTDLLRLSEFARARLTMERVPGSHGGTVTLEVLAPDPAVGPGFLSNAGSADIRVNEAASGIIAPTDLEAMIFVTVKNPESTAIPSEGVSPRTATVEPVVWPAKLAFGVRGGGRLQVLLDGTVLSVADVSYDPITGPQLTAVEGAPPPPRLTAGVLTMPVYPASPAKSEVTIDLAVQGSTSHDTKRIPLRTKVEYVGALPIGHTFVKDVSVTTGHLAKQFRDLELPGRGGGLTFSRSYSSQGSGPSPLGNGWTHSYRSYVVADPYAVGFASDVQGRAQEAGHRYLIVGGDGTGQTFICSVAGVCTPQRGFHGTLSIQPDGAGQGLSLVYTSKSGVRYTYANLNTNVWPYRYPLQSIVHPAGPEIGFTYHGPEFDYEVRSVDEPGRLRSLRFYYGPAPVSSGIGPRRSVLSEVRLETPSGTSACLAFTYDPETQNLTRAERREGDCGGEVLRTESYGYVDSPVPGLRNNLASYTDPNGVSTTYEWYADAEPLPGEQQFIFFGDKRERVRRVVEPAPGGATTFVYSLEHAAIGVAGSTVTAYTTTVLGPRPEVTAPTVYRVDPYGATATVERPVRSGQAAVSQTLWDTFHVRPLVEIDPRGRRTTYGYDARGNTIERRISGAALAASGGAPATAPLGDGAGGTLAEAVERWAYHPEFAGVTCHADASGRVTVTEYHATTGLPIASRRQAETVLPGDVAAASRCEALVRAPSPQDVTWARRYCGANGPCTATQVRPGDLVESVDGEGNVTTVLGFDGFGNPERTERDGAAGVSLATTRRYDDRSRMLSEADTLGHHLLRGYDGLDRVTREERTNGRGSSPGPISPGTTKTFGYAPGGQVVLETDALGLVRTTILDDLGRPAEVSESGPGLPVGGLTTRITYDAAGNRTDVVDRRGVRTRTTFDWGDRPTEVRTEVAPEDAARFAEQGGDPASVGIAGVVATYEHDLAGNRIAETDLHGHRTELILDPLYRAVGVRSPRVPGAAIGAPAVEYETARWLDLAGNKTRETDGNGNATAYAYDFANRLVRTTDAAGRVEGRSYDRNGNLRVLTQEAGGVQYTRTTGFDGLNRPLGVTEEVAGRTGITTYTSASVYDDAEHVVYTTDRRGYVTTQRLDDLDRVYETVVDDAPPSVARPPSPPARRLVTRRRWDAAGNPRVTIDPLGRETTEEHDALGRLTSRTLPMGVTEGFGYDGEGHVIERTDRRRMVTRTSFDRAGRATVERLVETLSGGGAELALTARTYDDNPTVAGLVSVTERDAKGSLTVRWSDALHREVRTVDAEGQEVVSAYDAVNRRAVRDRNRYVTEYTYDAANRPTQQRELGTDGAVVYTQTTSYDDVARTQSSSDRRGLTPTTTEQDGLGRVVRLTRGGQETLTEHDGNGNVVRLTDPNGHVTAAEFDGANRRISETRGHGTAVASTTTYRYDDAGNRVETKSARNTGVAYDLRETYDDLNRPVRTEDALGNVTTRAFDEGGNKLCEKRPLGNAGGAAFAHGGAGGLSVAGLRAAVCTPGHLMEYAYDEQSKLVAVTDARGGEHTFVYDEVRNLIAKQDANGNLTTYVNDRLGRRRYEHQHLDLHVRLARYSRGPVPLEEGAADPVVGVGTLTWSYLYDGNGNLTSVTDPKGTQVTNAYGVLDRLETQTWWYGTLPAEYPAISRIGYVRDGNGNLTEVTERKLVAAGSVDEVTGRVFDVLDRLESETRYDGKVVGYGYDAKGNRTRVTDPDLVETTYTYDAQDRVETATAAGRTATYGYWPDGLLRHTSLASGVEEGRCYDAAGRLTDLVTARGTIAADCTTTAPVLSRYGYGYDANGNRRTQTERRTDPATQALRASEATEYGYDELDRLTGVGYPDGRVVLYRHDAVGNRTGEREVQTAGGTGLGTFASPPPGTLTRDVVGTFNRADWLLSRTDAVDAGRSVGFGYDLAGNQVTRTQGGVERRYAWDGRNTLTAAFEGGVERGRYDYDRNLQRVKRRTGAENVEYVLDDRFVLQETDASVLEHPVYRRYHYAAQPLAVADATGFTFLSVDALGSVGDQTTTSGTVAAARQYDAWGQYRGGTAPSSAQPKLGYTGHQFDPETGLVYARARYYDAETGTFLSRDTVDGTLSDAPSLHRFAYVRGNPLRFTDADGFMAADGAGSPSTDRWASTVNQQVQACNAGDQTACNFVKVGVGTVAVAVVATVGVVALPAVGGGAGAAGGSSTLIALKSAGAGALAWVARNSQRITSFIDATADCIQSGSLEGCAISYGTAGAYSYSGRKGQTVAVENGEAPGAVPVARRVPGAGPDTAPPARRASVGEPPGGPTSGETESTRIGKTVHRDEADVRRESGEFSQVNSPITDRNGNVVLVPTKVDLKTGEPQAGAPLQTANPDAVSYPRRLIVDDKPLGRPLAKDRQEIIRFIKAYERREGELPSTIAIQRYDPETGAPVRTDLHKPEEFLPIGPPPPPPPPPPPEQE